jgi:hypothetical protein
MVQEIIVYIILLLTGMHLLYKTVLFFIPTKGNGNGAGCSGGSCSNCSLKFDMDSIQLNTEKPRHTNNSIVDIKQWN